MQKNIFHRIESFQNNKTLNDCLAMSSGCSNVVYLSLESVKKNLYKSFST